MTAFWPPLSGHRFLAIVASHSWSLLECSANVHRIRELFYHTSYPSEQASRMLRTITYLKLAAKARNFSLDFYLQL